MALTVYAAPAEYPVTLAEARLWCRYDGTDQDTMISMLIAAATQHAETMTRRALITQTLDLTLDAFPTWDLWVPRPPLQSVTSITYVDTDGATQTLSGSLYRVDIKTEPGRITPAYGQTWPSTRAQSGAVVVRYVAGYGAAAAVPACIKHWMQARLAALDLNREEEAVGPGMLRPAYIDSLLDPVRAPSWEWAQ